MTTLREKSTDSVYQQLRTKILSNEFRPGMQLLERDLVSLFGVSRTPVREALVRLQKENLLQIVPRHGIRVRQVSLADIEEINQVQTSLEATAAGIVAAATLRAKDLAPFDQALQRHGAGAREKRPRRLVRRRRSLLRASAEAGRQSSAHADRQ
ncbi:GntR family transcriptional regulator [Paraburkholderia bryophila]|uniref:GntR family transcriptional regulator n=1 Tax=Paraburkholderia bryophila TaxID=420952 RepID=UPI0027B95EFF|nr:GntR family transcriptional regulator [Paraburkholderia bryophila]